MSSLAIDNPDWFATPNLNDSPFVNFYIPNDNEPHVTVTAESAQFALDEIRDGVLSVGENQFSNQFILAQNPVQKNINIVIPSNTSIQNLTATVFSITGQRLMQKTWARPSQELIWDHNLSNGIYLLKLDNGISTQTIKMIVE